MDRHITEALHSISVLFQWFLSILGVGLSSVCDLSVWREGLFFPFSRPMFLQFLAVMRALCIRRQVYSCSTAVVLFTLLTGNVPIKLFPIPYPRFQCRCSKAKPRRVDGSRCP